MNPRPDQRDGPVYHVPVRRQRSISLRQVPCATPHEFPIRPVIKNRSTRRLGSPPDDHLRRPGGRLRDAHLSGDRRHLQSRPRDRRRRARLEGFPGTDGRLHSWHDVADRDAVVVAFTCNSCPYAVDYEQRIDDLARKHAGKDARVAVIAINSNLIPEDAPEAMKRRAEERGFSFPYLFDASQEVAKSFGAVRTPEFFVLDRERRIVYMGGFDDSTKPADVKKRHVEDAVEAVLAGREVAVKETAPIGCLIRFDRKRARR